MNETPRMTAAEADARFAALVADHRGAKGGQRSRTGRPKNRRELDGTLTTIVVVIAFCLGVACGALAPRRPLLALVIGVPLILVASHLIRRRGPASLDD